MITQNTDQQLINSYLLGDQEAMTVLVNRYIKLVYSLAFHYLKNSKDAQDITQEVFIKVWRFLEKFDANKSFKSWLYVITKSCINDFFRKNKKDLKYLVDLEAAEIKAGQDFVGETMEPLITVLDKQLEAENIWRHAERLPIRQQQIMDYIYKKELSYTEISELLKMPINTLKSLHRRAILQLKKIIK